MASDKTALGDRMKRYELVTRMHLPRRTYGILRVDGRAFHTYLKGCEKPFDPAVSDVMELVALRLCEEVGGAKFAYQQSDEVSVLFTDFDNVHTEQWFGGSVQKIASVSASIATGAFIDHWGMPHGRGPAQFDGRVFSISDPVEVANYFLWRQRDCVRNSVQSAAQHYFPQRDLQNLNGDQLQERLFAEHGVNWGKYPERHKNGSVVQRMWRMEGNGPWSVRPAPQRFEAAPGSFLADVIPPLPTLAA